MFVYMMLFVTGYATYYCYFPFSSSYWINVYSIYNDYTCYISIILYCVPLFYFYFSAIPTQAFLNHFLAFP